MEVIAAGLIAAAAAVLSSWLTARHMRSATDTQIAAARDAEEKRYERDLRREAVVDLKSLMGEFRGSIGALIFYAAAVQTASKTGMSDEQMREITGISGYPQGKLLELNVQITMKLPTRAVIDAWAPSRRT